MSALPADRHLTREERDLLAAMVRSGAGREILMLVGTVVMHDTGAEPARDACMAAARALRDVR